MPPSAFVSSVMRPLRRAEMTGGVIRRPLFFPGARKPGYPLLGMGKERSKFAFRHRLVSQPELDRDIVKPARREAAIEVSQSRNDHPDDGDLDVGPGLIEDEEIEAGTLCDIDAG